MRSIDGLVALAAAASSEAIQSRITGHAKEAEAAEFSFAAAGYGPTVLVAWSSFGQLF